MFIRETYLGGTLEVLSETGAPWPPEDTRHVYVARRQGNDARDGAIIVINNHATLGKGLWISTSPEEFSDWAGETLVNALDASQMVTVEADGRVYLEAPPRGWTIWVKAGDYQAYAPGA